MAKASAIWPGILLIALGVQLGAQQPVASLRLRQAIAEALTASPLLRTAADQTETAEIRRRLAASRFALKISPTFSTGADPSISGQRSVGFGASRRLPTGTELQATTNSYTYSYGSGGDAFRDTGYSLAISQPLLRGLGPSATFDLTNARRGVETAERGLDDARQQLIVSVAQAYFNVIRQSRLLEASTRGLDRARRLRTASEARAKVGLATELDVLRADLFASQAEAALALATENESTALDDLKVLIGRNPDNVVTIGDEDLTDGGLVAAGLTPGLSDIADTRIAPQEPAAAESFVAIALGRRVDLREAHDRIKDAKRTAEVAKWNLLPQVNFTLGYTRRGLGAASSPLFNELFTGWRYGVTTSYDLDRSDQTAAHATAEIGVRAADRQALDLQRQVGAEVRRAHRAWLRAAQTIELQRKAADIAERQLRIAELRYERGLAGNFDVVDAENNLFQAQSALVGAEIDRALAGLSLKRVTGTLRPDGFQMGVSSK